MRTGTLACFGAAEYGVCRPEFETMELDEFLMKDMTWDMEGRRVAEGNELLLRWPEAEVKAGKWLLETIISIVEALVSAD